MLRNAAATMQMLYAIYFLAVSAWTSLVCWEAQDDHELLCNFA